MSSVEEPPSKITKYEDLQYLEEAEECLEEALEEGQEEWLSEGVLTDDDYVIQQHDTELSTNTSQDNTHEDVSKDTDASAKLGQTIPKLCEVIEKKPQDVKQEEYIEETLNNLDGAKEFPDDLDTFLIRKTDGKVLETNKKEESVSQSQEQNDGNDTDDLLRMLGDGEQKTKKKLVKHKPSQDKEDVASSDDEFYFERSKVKTLKIAKNAIIKKAPIKAESEDMSDGDDETEPSSDECSTVQRIFKVKNPVNTVNKNPPPKKIVKHVVQINNNYNNKNEKSTPKPTTKLQNSKQILKSLPTKTPKLTPKVDVKTPAPFRPIEKPKGPLKKEPTAKKDDKVVDDYEEIFAEEEFLEGDDIDLDEEEFCEDSDSESKKQRIMRPERMDEEIPSDADSHSEGGSLYDELPSSESEDMDDWFTLDIRAERAADYLPLLGTKARDLLLAERRRVTSRVSTLKQSLSALTDSARRQADQLRAAAMALAEIDDTLRAA